MKNPLIDLWGKRNTPSMPKPYPKWIMQAQYKGRWGVKREN